MEPTNQPRNDQVSTEKPLERDSITVPVLEEQISVSLKTVETGRVRLVKQVKEEEIMVEAPLLYDQTLVERVAINQHVEFAPEVRYEGDTMIIPVMREEVVVTKRLVLVEEIRVTKQQVSSVSTQPVLLRQETITVERIPSDPLQQHSTE
jgi:uncharacterized protein (TIGR02271 family)